MIASQTSRTHGDVADVSGVDDDKVVSGVSVDANCRSVDSTLQHRTHNSK